MIAVYLRLRNLQVSEMAGTVLVVKLEFERLPTGEVTGQGSEVMRR